MEEPVHPLRWIGRKLAGFRSEQRDDAHVTTSRPDLLGAADAARGNADDEYWTQTSNIYRRSH